MIFEEIEFDLFKVNEELATSGEGLYDLAHCISADFAMSGGIAVEFNKRWDMRNRLKTKYTHAFPQFQFTNGLAIAEEVSLNDGNQFMVYNLVTKEQVTHIPTILSIKNALVDMRDSMILNNSTKVAMPHIGCGIDQQDWGAVKLVIKDVFAGTNIEVLACQMPKNKKTI